MQKGIKLRRIAWKLSRLTSKVASVRYRCFLPAKFLRRHGVHSTFFQAKDTIDFSCFDAIVFVKTFTDYDNYLAQKAQDHGVKIFLDVCDNPFFVSNDLKKNAAQYSHLIQMATIAQKIFCPTLELKLALAKEISEHKICVLPDPIEEKNHSFEFAKKIPGYYLARIFHSGRFAIFFLYVLRVIQAVSSRRRLRPILLKVWDFWVTKICTIFDVFVLLSVKFVARAILLVVPSSVGSVFEQGRLSPEAETETRPAKQKMQLVEFEQLQGPVLGWFGNCGSPGVFGISDLLILKNDLERLSKAKGSTLLVVTDNPLQLSLFSQLDLKICFVKWDLTTIYAAIQKMEIVLLPNRKNEFSICKSPNRAIFALLLGKPVVITSNQSNEFLNDCVLRAGDWYSAICDYLENPDKVADHVERSRKIILQTLSPDILGNKWFDELTSNETQQAFNVQVANVIHS